MTQQMVTIEIHGVKSTIEYLRRYEPQAYRQINAEMRARAKPIASTTARAFPTQIDQGIRNWAIYGHLPKQKKRTDRGESGYTFPRYQTRSVRSGVKVQVGGRKNRATNTYPILRIKQTDGAGMIYDMANIGHSASGTAFINKIGGPASRVMWKTVPKQLPAIQAQIASILRAFEKQYSIGIGIDMLKREKIAASSQRQVRNALGQFGKFMR